MVMKAEELWQNKRKGLHLCLPLGQSPILFLCLSVQLGMSSIREWEALPRKKVKRDISRLMLSYVKKRWLITIGMPDKGIQCIFP